MKGIDSPSDKEIDAMFGRINSKEIRNDFIDKEIFTPIENYKIEKIVQDYILKDLLNVKHIVDNSRYSFTYNPNKLKLLLTPNQLLITPSDRTVVVGPENIGEFILPMVEFIRQNRPDYIVACDRGARYLGVGVYALYKEIYGELPTQDRKLHFRRISKSNPEDATEEHLRPLVEHMLGEVVDPRVLVLDDWVNMGVTKQMVTRIFSRLSNGRIQLTYGVLRGGNADVTGTPNDNVYADWHDDASKIGVDYPKEAYLPEDAFVAMANHSPESIEYRRRMLKHLRELGSLLRKTKSNSGKLFTDLKL